VASRGGRGTGNPIMMRMIFALIDTDGDGAIELQEFQAAHERLFKAMDTNKDGRLTLEEMQTFMQGGARPPESR
jgi:Ca2+-binding EF-hand superfamily protein